MPSTTPANIPIKIQAVSEMRFIALPISISWRKTSKNIMRGGRIRLSEKSELWSTIVSPS